jgi:putative transposase
LISRDRYRLGCGSYVELNPVRAGIVKDPGGYQWSSYRTYAYGKTNPLVDEHSIYRELSEDESDRRKKYREFVKGMLRSKDSMKGELIKPIGRPKREPK